MNLKIFFGIGLLSLLLISLFSKDLGILNPIRALAFSYGTSGDVSVLDLRIIDPYDCGQESIYGTLVGGYGKKVVEIKLENPNNSYTFQVTVKDDGSWQHLLDYQNIVPQRYKITVTGRDEIGNSRILTYESLVQKNCTEEQKGSGQSQDKKVVAVLIRTGASQKNIPSAVLFFMSLFFTGIYLKQVFRKTLER